MFILRLRIYFACTALLGKDPAIEVDWISTIFYSIRFETRWFVLAVQKVLSGSGRARRLRLMGRYIGHRLVARLELDYTFWAASI